MNWKPLSKFVLVRLHTKGSSLDLSASDIKYNGLADVLAVGPEVAPGLSVGDVVMLNGPQGIISHTEMEEHVGLVASPLLLAVRVDAEIQH